MECERKSYFGRSEILERKNLWSVYCGSLSQVFSVWSLLVITPVFSSSERLGINLESSSEKGLAMILGVCVERHELSVSHFQKVFWIDFFWYFMVVSKTNGVPRGEKLFFKIACMLEKWWNVEWIIRWLLYHRWTYFLKGYHFWILNFREMILSRRRWVMNRGFDGCWFVIISTIQRSLESKWKEKTSCWLLFSIGSTVSVISVLLKKQIAEVTFWFFLLLFF